jgi:predicted DCC family thiol-disulfide oxidoreductase YuxK
MAGKIWPIQVFYDGSCPVCVRQARHWDDRDRNNRLRMVDISDPDFDAGKHDLDEDEIQESIHVKTADGRVFEGIDAVRVIWSAFPEMWAPAFVAGLPGIHGILGFGYRTFARNRHRLTDGCDDGNCGMGPDED